MPGVAALCQATLGPESVMSTVGKLLSCIPDAAYTRVIETDTGTSIHVRIGVQDITPVTVQVKVGRIK